MRINVLDFVRRARLAIYRLIEGEIIRLKILDHREVPNCEECHKLTAKHLCIKCKKFFFYNKR